jgi:methyl-accepting chemotaxis protein
VSKQAGDAFGKIVKGIRQTSQAISEVSSAAEEQLGAVKMIADSVQQVAEQTEKSAAASDGIDKSCRELDLGAQRLNTAFVEFKAKG